MVEGTEGMWAHARGRRQWGRGKGVSCWQSVPPRRASWRLGARTFCVPKVKEWPVVRCCFITSFVGFFFFVLCFFFGVYGDHSATFFFPAQIPHYGGIVRVRSVADYCATLAPLPCTSDGQVAISFGPECASAGRPTHTPSTPSKGRTRYVGRSCNAPATPTVPLAMRLHSSSSSGGGGGDGRSITDRKRRRKAIQEANSATTQDASQPAKLSDKSTTRAPRTVRKASRARCCTKGMVQQDAQGVLTRARRTKKRRNCAKPHKRAAGPLSGPSADDSLPPTPLPCDPEACRSLDPVQDIAAPLQPPPPPTSTDVPDTAASTQSGTLFSLSLSLSLSLFLYIFASVVPFV